MKLYYYNYLLWLDDKYTEYTPHPPLRCWPVCVQVSDSGEGGVDVLSEVAMSNAYLICHNVQVTSRELRASILTFILHTWSRWLKLGSDVLPGLLLGRSREERKGEEEKAENVIIHNI